jgi:hypothetical protein
LSCPHDNNCRATLFRSMAQKKRTARGGRPPAGVRGERVRDYKHQLTTRLRGSDFHLLVEISKVTMRSYRDILTDAIELYVSQRVTRGDRAAILESSTRAQRHCSRCQDEAAAR